MSHIDLPWGSIVCNSFVEEDSSIAYSAFEANGCMLIFSIFI